MGKTELTRVPSVDFFGILSAISHNYLRGEKSERMVTCQYVTKTIVITEVCSSSIDRREHSVASRFFFPANIIMMCKSAQCQSIISYSHMTPSPYFSLMWTLYCIVSVFITIYSVTRLL